MRNKKKRKVSQPSNMAPARKGCWTCKDRKVSCDRTIPTCLRCSKSKRACGGYGLRLSWPQQNDCKRAVASLVAFRDKYENEHDPGSYQNIQWVNVSSKDVSLHHIATVSRGNSKFRKPQLGREQWAQFQTPLPLPLPLGGLRSGSICDENHLHYFESVLSNMLPMFDSDRAEIRDVLLKMALTDDSHSSHAVLFSLLALSSLHESGPQLRAIQLRDRANRALIRSSQEGLDAAAGIKHVAAGILLCLFEAQGSPERSCVWVGHICGAKYVVNAVRKLDISPGSDASKILGWVYYYEILARFSFRHWRTELVRQAVEELGFEPTKHGCQLQYLIARDSFSSFVPNMSDHAHPLLGVLYKVFDIILSPWGSQYHTEEYQTYLDELSSDLENLPLTSTHAHSRPSQLKSPHGPTMVEALELAQLAALVYLERISRNFSGSSAKLAHWSHRAFSLFAKIDTYLFPFPLFILACEASSDEERMVILELLERTERVPHMQNFSDVRMLVERAWSQQDLETEGELEYLRKINIVLSSCDFVPCFW